MTDPQWSPDGKYIAMNAVERQEFWFDDASDIYLLQMSGRNLHKLKMDQYVTDLNGAIHMDWGPDSRTLYFRFNVHGDMNIWAVNVEGNGVATQVTNGEGVVHALSVAPSGNYIALVGPHKQILETWRSSPPWAARKGGSPTGPRSMTTSITR